MAGGGDHPGRVAIDRARAAWLAHAVGRMHQHNGSGARGRRTVGHPGRAGRHVGYGRVMAKTLPRLSARHTANTRSALIRAGRELFTKKGYDATSTDEIVERSRLSKGALYHHFSSKHELFRAVFEDVEAALIRRSGAEADDFPPAGSPAFWEES